jgi:hypothetical protein
MTTSPFRMRAYVSFRESAWNGGLRGNGIGVSRQKENHYDTFCTQMNDNRFVRVSLTSALLTGQSERANGVAVLADSGAVRLVDFSRMSLVPL